VSRPSISVLDAQPANQTAAPALVFRLRIETGDEVQAIALQCQVLIDTGTRRYDPGERQRLFELFGDASQFDRLLRPLTWAHCGTVVRGFAGSTDVDLHVACTYDLDLGPVKYLHAVRDGSIPLAFLFRGTMFRLERGGLRVEPVSWDVEAAFELPATIWRAAMDQFFPGGGWLRVRKETIDRLQGFRGRAAVVGWDAAIELLLERARREGTA
jgi:hypothetical protein